MSKKLLLISVISLFICSLTSCSGDGFSKEITDSTKKEEIRTSLKKIALPINYKQGKIIAFEENERVVSLKASLDLNVTFMIANYHFSGSLYGSDLLGLNYEINGNLKDDSGYEVGTIDYKNDRAEVKVNDYKILNINVVQASTMSVDFVFSTIQNYFKSDYFDYMQFLDIKDSDDFKVKQKTEEGNFATYILSIDADSLSDKIGGFSIDNNTLTNIYLGPKINTETNVLNGFSMTFSVKYSVFEFGVAFNLSFDEVVAE